MLHVANWYPTPWNDIEGNFVRDQVRLFRAEIPGEAVVVAVRHDARSWLRFRRLDLGEGVRGYFLLTRVRPGKVTEWLTTVLLTFVLLVNRAWKYDILHVHIAYPLTVHAKVWRRFAPRVVMVTEHWSAYHDNFYMSEDAPALSVIRRAFSHGFPVLAVSQSLLNDIRRFARRDDFPGFVLPNAVPLHGASKRHASVPTLFAVSIWREIKDPMPMLRGLAAAAQAGSKFNVVLGGFGELLQPMQEFVAQSSLAERTAFPGKMTKSQIASALAEADGYLFSSRYETFSVACAEALGAGVPLIGPHLDAVAEYAGPEDWVRVASRDAAGWEAAIVDFVTRHREGRVDGRSIAARAEARFSAGSIRARYRDVIKQIMAGGAS